MEIKQGDIYWVTIKPEEVKGSEQHGRRPVVVVSRLAVNRTLNTVLVVPLSSKNVMNQPPYRIVVPVTEIAKDPACNSVLVVSVAKTDQVRVIDKTRLEEKIGALSQTATVSVLIGLANICDIR
jgi:mRNA interferase MazF